MINQVAKDPQHRASHTSQASSIVSNAIIVSRVCAIFFMMYVHAEKGADVPRAGFAQSSLDTQIRFVLVDIFGRSSVPLLTIISAYLLSSRESISGFRTLLGSKVRTLLVPMWFWNLAYLALIGAGMILFNLPAPERLMDMAWYDAVFAVTDEPAQIPLAFLRDIFVCVILSPILVRLVRHVFWPSFMLSLVFAVIEPAQFILLRPQILAFFLVGLWFGINGGVPTLAGRRVLPLTVLALIGLVAIFLVTHGFATSVTIEAEWLQRLLSNFSRFFVAWLFWVAALRLAATPWLNAFQRVEPFVFLAFCSHVIVFNILVQGVRMAGLDTQMLFYIQPALAFAAAAAGAMVLARIAPGILRIANAGRLPKARASASPGAPSRG